jgi:hypothetical protein
MVTGIRQDAWANAHRIPVEEDKPEAERGSYLAPELWGQSEEKGLIWRQEEGLRSAKENSTVGTARRPPSPVLGDVPFATSGRSLITKELAE